MREQIAGFDVAIQRRVKADPTCRLLMSVPGVGALSALAFVSTIEDPARFLRSRAFGAHLGLTPRRYQSGEIARSGRIAQICFWVSGRFVPTVLPAFHETRFCMAGSR